MPEPGALKKGWTRVAFGDVVKLSGERSSSPEEDGLERFVGLDHIDPGDLKLRRWGDISDGTTFTSVFRPGQVLFGKRRAYQRKVAVADFSGVCSGDIYVLEPASTQLFPELLPFICQTEGFFEHAVGTSAGSLSPRTNWDSLATFEFCLPPLSEQARIVEVLHACEQLRGKYHAARGLAWSARISAYWSFTQQGAGYGRMKDTPFGRAPAHWTVAPLKDVLAIENRYRKPICAAIRSTMPGPFGYYGPTGRIDSINEYRLDGTFALIGEDGDHFLKHSLWSMTQFVTGRFNVNNHAHILRGTDRCLTEWFFHFYRHRDIGQWLTKQGAARLKLKKATLEQMPILLPPIREQEEIAEALARIAAATDSLEERAGKAGSLLHRTIATVLERS